MSDGAYESNDAWSQLKALIIKAWKFAIGGEPLQSIGSSDPLIAHALFLGRQKARQPESIESLRRKRAVDREIEALEMAFIDSPPVKYVPFEICVPSADMVCNAAGDLWLEIGNDGLAALETHLSLKDRSAENLRDFVSRLQMALTLAEKRSEFDISLEKAQNFVDRLALTLEVVSVVEQRAHKYPLREHPFAAAINQQLQLAVDYLIVPDLSRGLE